MQQRGFSLIELLISTAIIVAICTLVITRFSSFDSGTLLKSLAYEIAATIREAQVHSVSVLGSDPNFKYPYGVTFTPGATSYVAFQYKNSTLDVRPVYDIGLSEPKAVAVGTYIIGRSMRIVDTCVTYTAGSSSHVACSAEGINRLDISFRRPEFKAWFNASGFSGSQSSIESAKIKLQSTKGGDIWEVSVGLLGNVSVKRAPQT